MNDKVKENVLLDTVKWGVALLLVLVAIAGNWYFVDFPLLYRVLAIVAISAFAIAMMLTTVRGKGFVALLSESRAEVRKVVWPTQQETRQTTLIVLVVVVLMALILWGFDSLLSYLVKLLIG